MLRPLQSASNGNHTAPQHRWDMTFFARWWFCDLFSDLILKATYENSNHFVIITKLNKLMKPSWNMIYWKFQVQKCNQKSMHNLWTYDQIVGILEYSAASEIPFKKLEATLTFVSYSSWALSPLIKKLSHLLCMKCTSHLSFFLLLSSLSHMHSLTVKKLNTDQCKKNLEVIYKQKRTQNLSLPVNTHHMSLSLPNQWSPPSIHIQCRTLGVVIPTILGHKSLPQPSKWPPPNIPIQYSTPGITTHTILSHMEITWDSNTSTNTDWQCHCMSSLAPPLPQKTFCSSKDQEPWMLFNLKTFHSWVTHNSPSQNPIHRLTSSKNHLYSPLTFLHPHLAHPSCQMLLLLLAMPVSLHSPVFNSFPTLEVFITNIKVNILSHTPHAALLLNISHMELQYIQLLFLMVLDQVCPPPCTHGRGHQCNLPPCNLLLECTPHTSGHIYPLMAFGVTTNLFPNISIPTSGKTLVEMDTKIGNKFCKKLNLKTAAKSEKMTMIAIISGHSSQTLTKYKYATIVHTTVVRYQVQAG